MDYECLPPPDSGSVPDTVQLESLRKRGAGLVLAACAGRVQAGLGTVVTVASSPAGGCCLAAGVVEPHSSRTGEGIRGGRGG